MREILFRAKDRTGILNHSWLYGSLDNLNEDFWHLSYKDRWGKKIIADIDISTVGQFTGLTDKNGKKIFEGDIVKVTYIEKRQYQGVPYDDEHCLTEEVFYSKENACFMLKVMCDDIPMYRPLHNFESLAKIKDIEVVGNIYDNPELLGE